MSLDSFFKKSEFKTTLYISLTTSSANALKQFNLHVYTLEMGRVYQKLSRVFLYFFFSIFGHFLMIFSNVEFELNGAIRHKLRGKNEENQVRFRVSVTL